MGREAVVRILLVVLAFAGCRSAAVEPGAPDEVPAAEELRVYAVADLLRQLDSVPMRGCCVLFVPPTRTVDFHPWAVVGEGAGVRPVPAEEAEREVFLPRVESGVRSALLARPEAALVDHLRSRLAAGDFSASSCSLSVRNGTHLVARGSPVALVEVERALAELRRKPVERGW